MVGGSKRRMRSQSACQFTRYIDYCQNTNLEDRSLGNQKLGKAEVDCGFLASEAKWGLVNDEHVGIFYLDLRFSQTSKYLLDFAEVEMTFSAEDKTGTGPIVVRYFAPEELKGPLREKRVEGYVELNPSFNLPVVGALSLGKVGRTSSSSRPYRWSFTGALSPVNDGSYYQKMYWRWESNELEPQAQVRLVHLAVAIRHASVPFSIELSMSGKLRGHYHRGIFGRQEKQKLTVVVPRILKEELRLGAADLIADIEWRNRSLRPLSSPSPTITTTPDPQTSNNTPQTTETSRPDAQAANRTSPTIETNPPAVLTESETARLFTQMIIQPLKLIHLWWLYLIEVLLRFSNRRWKA